MLPHYLEKLAELRHCRRHSSVAVFVNIVFSDEDKILLLAVIKPNMSRMS